MIKSARFSECRRYRYDLWRRWSDGETVAFIGLNPSTADETNDDPTIRKCMAYAKRWGYGSMVMLNLFAFRATQPKDMLAAEDPVGPDNDRILKEVCGVVSAAIAAWGKHGTFRSRDQNVIAMIGDLAALKLNSDGTPGHPLYLHGDLKPFPLTLQSTETMSTKIITPDVTLRTDQEKRMPPDKMQVFIDALLDDNHKMALSIHHLGEPKGFSRKWLEITAKNANGLYYMVFGLKDDDYVRQLWIVVGPSGGGYSIDKDGPMIVGGKPQEFLPQDVCEKLSKLLIRKRSVREVVINTYYRVEFKEGDNMFGIGAMFDKGPSGEKGVPFPRALASYSIGFLSRDDAERAAKEMRLYLEDQKTSKESTNAMSAKTNTKEDVACHLENKNK